MTDLPIIFEDDALIVLDKPAGLIVNRATSHHQRSLQELMTEYLHLPTTDGLTPPDQFAPPQAVFAFRQGLVHRLDKDTSGLILWAKTPASLAALLAQFQARQVRKTYTALVHGLIHDPSGRLNYPLERARANRQIMAVSASGRPALTLYEVTQHYRSFAADDFYRKFCQNQPGPLGKLHARDLQQLYQGFTLLTAHPRTGRTHQIRAHFTHIGHPLVGDTAYLPRRKAHLDPLWCPRQFLHASQIEFTHPVSGAPLTFTSPLPEDLQAALEWLSQN